MSYCIAAITRIQGISARYSESSICPRCMASYHFFPIASSVIIPIILWLKLAITLSAFLLLLIECVADKQKSWQDRLSQIKTHKLLFPLCGFHYTPTKPHFLPAVKWTVLQYIIIRPLITIIGIICQSQNVLCTSKGFNPHYASVYLASIDFASISVALYGLFLFYSLTKTELEGKRPVAKFLSIKLIIVFSFYQGFIFNALEGRVIHATQFWTETNIADGLNSLAICIEMVFFAALMLWAFPYTDYRRPAGEPATKLWRPLWDSINYYDLAKEIYWSGLHFVKRKKYDVEREKPQEDPRKIVNRPILKTTNDPQSSQRVMEEPSGVVPRDDPFDTWTRWQRKEMSSV